MTSLIASTLMLQAVLAPQVRTASVCHPRIHNRTMANGRPYRHHAVSLASNDWPLGTILAVSHGRVTIRAKVTDRMAVRFSQRRIDLSGGAWKALTNGAKPGLRRVTVRVLP